MRSLYSLLPELSLVPQYHSYSNGKAGGRQSQPAELGGQEVPAGLESGENAANAAKEAEEFRRELAAKIEELEANHRLALEMARISWAEEEGRALAEQIHETLAGLEMRIGQSLQQIMQPFVEKLIPQAAMADFVQILDGALQEDFRGPLHLSGPEDLVAAVREHLSLRKIEVMLDPAAGEELKARAKNFVVTTRIKNWADGIAGSHP
jgi:hypothetical protein